MVNNFEKRQSANDQQNGDADRSDHNINGEDFVASRGSENQSSVTLRLTQILMGGGDGDLLLQSSADREDGVLQWIRALDMQMMGACRADERLKPLLKLNVSSGVVEDRLLAHLSQHFEPSEVGILARCLCIPLVSIRVGKISKQGTLLSPTPIRGNLCLTLLPTSYLRISFNGDDGSVERLATLSTKTPCVFIEIDEISADKSGRSFSVKTSSDSPISYYWCSEKSKLLGDELLRKMKDLLMRRPSLAGLSGISESRLNCFVSNLRAYLAGSMPTSSQSSGIIEATFSSEVLNDSSELNCTNSSFKYHKGPRSLQNGSQGSRTNLICQSSHNTRSSLTKNSSSIRNAAREILRRQGENHVPSIDNLCIASSNWADTSRSNNIEENKLHEVSNFFDLSGKSVGLPFLGPEIQVPFSGPAHFPPHYCWCPPVSQLPISSNESFSLPPLSTLLSATSVPSSLFFTSKPSMNLPDLPSLNFPGFMPDSPLRSPTLQTSQQIPAFTPFICDPIVHIPVIDVCSSGQGYLVSAGHGLSTTIIPPLNSNLVNSLLPNTESMVEKSARETLRMLINGSNQFKPQSSVPSSNDDLQNVMIVSGSRGLYNGTGDLDAITNRVSFLWSDDIIGGGIGKRCGRRDDLSDTKEKPSSSGSSSFDESFD